jgi:hypothetical protein
MWIAPGARCRAVPDIRRRPVRRRPRAGRPYVVSDGEVEVLVKVVFFAVLGFLFLGMIAMQLVGHRFALHRRENDPLAGSEGTAAVEAALYALLGLMVAFTFSGAEERLNARRQLIVEEVSAIGTAYMRLDLLEPEDALILRDEMRAYLDARLAYYDKLLNFAGARAERRRADQLQQQIWSDAVAATGRAGDARAATLLVLQSLNQLFDVATARYAALRTHVPGAIFILLLALALVCAFFAGVGMARRRGHASPLHVLMFAGILAVVAYVILNLEFPRAGFVRLHGLDQFLIEQRASMK